MGEDIQVFWSESLHLPSEPEALILHEVKVTAQDHKHPYVLCHVFMLSLGGDILGSFPHCKGMLEAMSL